MLRCAAEIVNRVDLRIAHAVSVFLLFATGVVLFDSSSSLYPLVWCLMALHFVAASIDDENTLLHYPTAYSTIAAVYSMGEAFTWCIFWIADVFPKDYFLGRLCVGICLSSCHLLHDHPLRLYHAVCTLVIMIPPRPHRLILATLFFCVLLLVTT